MSLHKEINFEDEICDHLAAHGWLYAEGDAASYDRHAGAVPGGRAGLGAGRSPRRGRPRPRTTAPAGETLLARLREQIDHARHAGRAAPRHRDARPEAEAARWRSSSPRWR